MGGLGTSSPPPQLEPPSEDMLEKISRAVVTNVSISVTSQVMGDLWQLQVDIMRATKHAALYVEAVETAKRAAEATKAAAANVGDNSVALAEVAVAAAAYTGEKAEEGGVAFSTVAWGAAGLIVEGIDKLVTDIGPTAAQHVDEKTEEAKAFASETVTIIEQEIDNRADEDLLSWVFSSPVTKGAKEAVPKEEKIEEPVYNDETDKRLAALGKLLADKVKGGAIDTKDAIMTVAQKTPATAKATQETLSKAGDDAKEATYEGGVKAYAVYSKVAKGTIEVFDAASDALSSTTEKVSDASVELKKDSEAAVKSSIRYAEKKLEEGDEGNLLDAVVGTDSQVTRYTAEKDQHHVLVEN